MSSGLKSKDDRNNQHGQEEEHQIGAHLAAEPIDESRRDPDECQAPREDAMN
jgi:hypothetical protein